MSVVNRLSNSRFHVRLIERVNAEDGTGHRGRDFPTEEFLSQIVRIVHRDAYDWMTGSFQLLNGSVLRRIGARQQPEIDKYAIVAIDIRLAECFAINRDQSLTFFFFAG